MAPSRRPKPVTGLSAARRPNFSSRRGGPGAARTCADSRVDMTEFVLPNDTNTHGSVLGGRVMHWIDLAAGLSAMRFSGKPVVTASVDELHFLGSVKLGETAVLRAEVTQAWHTSVEVHVQVQAEDMATGIRRPTTAAYLTFVAVDSKGRPTAVPPIKLRTPAEERRARHADIRREHRRESRKRILAEMGVEG